MTPEDYFSTHFDPEFAKKTFGVVWTDQAITFPIYDDSGRLLFQRYRHLTGDNKFTADKGSHPALFAIHKIKKEPWVVLCEGEGDAVRLWQEGFPAVTGSGVKTFTAKMAAPLKGKIVNICLDTDTAGQQSVQQYCRIMEEVGATPKIVDLPSNYKDVCEYFTAGNTKDDFHLLLQNALTPDDWLDKHTPEEYKTITVEELFDTEYPEESWIIDKTLPRTGFVMYSGDSGVGKSWIALEIVRAITNNDIYLDHFEIKTPNVPILIIDKENGLRRIQKRMKGLGIERTQNTHLLLYPEKFGLTDEGFVATVKRFIEKKQIGIVIIDSFIDILVGNENDAGDTVEIFNALRGISTNVCWVLLHHEVKPVPRFQPTAGNRARGSGNIKAQLDYLFSVQATSSPKVINIEQGKARDYEMIPKFALEFITIEETKEMGGFRYLGEVKGEVSKVDEAIDFIMAYLVPHPDQTRQQIIDAAEGGGVTKSSVDRALKIMKEKKLIDTKPDPLNGRRKLFTILEIVDDVDEVEQLDFSVD